MTVIFSILLSPVFFIIYYAIGEYVFPTKNGAIVFAFFAMSISVYIYYTVRKQVSQLTKEKTAVKNAKEEIKSGLMLLEPEKFAEIFPKKALCNNSYGGVNEEAVLSFLREHGCREEIDIYSVNGITNGAKDLLNLLNIKSKIHLLEEIIKMGEAIPTPFINKKEQITLFKKIIFGIKSPVFRKFAIKYGVTITLVGLITPYRIYYLIFGISLFLYGIFSVCLGKISQRNQIPYPRF